MANGSPVEYILKVGNQLGEGPIWDARNGALLWVDIEGYCFHRFFPATAKLETIDTGISICALGLVEDSAKLLMATAHGIAFWNWLSRSVSPVISDFEPERHESRLNDGAVDRQGNFWVGSLGPDSQSALYRLGPGLSLRRMDSGFGVSNGIAWSPDNRTMYFTDSRCGVIFAYDFDTSSNSIENRRILVEVPEGKGVPDGLTVDSEGFLWSARWGGARIASYDPTGRLAREIMLPVTYPTSCTFGGKNLDELYITSARSPLSASECAKEPLAGGLLRIDARVRGLDEPRFRE
jgi:sugar lactone lactonase YvrE